MARHYEVMSKFVCFMVFLGGLLCGCARHDKAETPVGLVPMPLEVEWGANQSDISRNGTMAVATDCGTLAGAQSALIQDMPDGCAAQWDDANVRITLCDSISVPGAYTLTIGGDLIELKGADVQGVAAGVATLKQIIGTTKGDRLPKVRIYDRPRLYHRGLMLDCARHFWSVDELKRLVNAMAMLKLNVLHLHLSDNQAWRMEVENHPELTKKGTNYPDFPELSGKFYTQEELKGLVGYATARGVEIVPEIDLPGHCLALLSSHAELSCKGGEFEPYPDEREHAERKRLGENMLCVGNPQAMAMADTIIDALCRVFPGQVLHLGGDEVSGHVWAECPKCQRLMRGLGLKEAKELQDWFTREVAAKVAARGRTMAGWEEINDRGAAQPGNLVYIWNAEPEPYLDKAVERGLDVVMCAKDPCYFDFSYSRNPTRKVYEWDPLLGRTDSATVAHVVGTQACLWTEFVPTEADMHRMLFPRLCALAEKAWRNDAENCDWADFVKRLEGLEPVLEGMEIEVFKGENFADDWWRAKEEKADSATMAEPASIDTNMGSIRHYEAIYAFDGDTTTFFSTPYSHAAGDYFAVKLDSAREVSRVRVITDLSRCNFHAPATLSVGAEADSLEVVASAPDALGRFDVRFDKPRTVGTVRIDLRAMKNSRLTIKEIIIE